MPHLGGGGIKSDARTLIIVSVKYFDRTIECPSRFNCQSFEKKRYDFQQNSRDGFLRYKLTKLSPERCLIKKIRIFVFTSWFSSSTILHKLWRRSLCRRLATRYCIHFVDEDCDRDVTLVQHLQRAIWSIFWDFVTFRQNNDHAAAFVSEKIMPDFITSTM